MLNLSDVTVLVVEDDRNVGSTIKSMLIEMGITDIMEANDGKQALEIIESAMGGLSLIICDWNMPRKSGLELLREVRQVNSGLPFLMITARADADSIIAAKESNVTGYIRKPFSFNDLETKVISIIRQRRFSLNK